MTWLEKARAITDVHVEEKNSTMKCGKFDKEYEKLKNSSQPLEKKMEIETVYFDIQRKKVFSQHQNTKIYTIQMHTPFQKTYVAEKEWTDRLIACKRKRKRQSETNTTASQFSKDASHLRVYTFLFLIDGCMYAYVLPCTDVDVVRCCCCCCCLLLAPSHMYAHKECFISFGSALCTS